MAKKKDDIDRTPMDSKYSGSKKRPMESVREEKIYPDKAYDPFQMIRQRYDEKGKEGGRLTQRIEDIVEEGRTFPEKVKKDRFSNLKKFLKNQ